MSAQIVIDDGTNPPVNGSADRDNSFLATAFTLSNFDDTGILAHRWTLRDKPIGSAAALTSGTDPTTQITPDIAGTYLVQLQTYLDAGATDLDDIDVEGIGVRFAVAFDHRVPAAGETDQFDSARGWATAREEAIRDLHAFLEGGGGGLTTVAVKVANYTANADELVPYDPSGGTFTLKPPATPSLGDMWAIKNVTTDITSITFDGNGENLEDPLTSTIVATFTSGALGSLMGITWFYDGTNWVVL
jgi:hypothetical protein